MASTIISTPIRFGQAEATTSISTTGGVKNSKRHSCFDQFFQDALTPTNRPSPTFAASVFWNALEM